MNCIAHVASVFYGSKPKCTKDDLARRKAFCVSFICMLVATNLIE